MPHVRRSKRSGVASESLVGAGPKVPHCQARARDLITLPAVPLGSVGEYVNLDNGRADASHISDLRNIASAPQARYDDHWKPCEPFILGDSLAKRQSVHRRRGEIKHHD